MAVTAVPKQATFEWAGPSTSQAGAPATIACPEVHGDDHGFLRARAAKPEPNEASEPVALVDLFCGAGGLSLGFHEAAKSLGISLVGGVALDADDRSLSCYAANLPTKLVLNEDVRTLFRPDLRDRLSKEEKSLAKQVTSTSILVGGPPCQGHSDLNNSTRRNDPKNSLYYTMARAAKVFSPSLVVIENVPNVIHDKGAVVHRTREALSDLGYTTYEHVFDFIKLGVPQTRKRHVLIAVTRPCDAAFHRLSHLGSSGRNLQWAIGDLVGKTQPGDPFNSVASPNAVTRERINYLFDRNIFDLPNEQRPACHRLKDHSYRSIYGRLSWDKPAQTMTRGFYCMCMGRYIHPEERRTLTAHEAARIQFFPDWFSFTPARGRTSLATMIGNAVPSKLGYVIGVELLNAAFGKVAGAK
jgi:DNA (cytosine-5)-methyltransferase 1